MPTKYFAVVPPEIWAALRLEPGAPVHWEVRGDEAVMRSAKVPSVDEVFGILRPHVKSRRKGAPTPTEMRAAAKQTVARRFRQSLKGVD